MYGYSVNQKKYGFTENPREKQIFVIYITSLFCILFKIREKLASCIVLCLLKENLTMTKVM